MLIVGTGAAGLSTALAASAAGRRVVLLAKRGLDGGSTPLAQGGLAAVLHPADSQRSHREDTLRAGAGLCDAQAVHELVAAAPQAIRVLQEYGARFDTDVLGLEGGHAHPRIVHAGGDASGAEIHRALVRAAAAAELEILANTVALDAITDEEGAVRGVVAGRISSTGALDVGLITANAVVLAAGGFGQAFTTTTNPLDATGDGLALAARAGADIVDVEFVQFHPTVLYEAGRRGRCALVTEALRGAGAVLVDPRGRPVTAGIPGGDLAPRDVVAFAMHQRMAEGPSAHLWLDARSLGSTRLARDFPTVTSACRSLGVDPSRDLIPVAPGAHYACGGVRADMDGRTSLAGLYAVGEVAATGVHGANRLASNSLTEAVATGQRLGRLLGRERDVATNSGRPGAPRRPSAGVGSDPGARSDLAAAMSVHAGVVRSGSGLERLLEQLTSAPAAAAAARLDLATVEATNLRTVSTLVARAALVRTESRGSHRRSDFPRSRDRWSGRVHLRMVDGVIVETPRVSA